MRDNMVAVIVKQHSRVSTHEKAGGVERENPAGAPSRGLSSPTGFRKLSWHL